MKRLDLRLSLHNSGIRWMNIGLILLVLSAFMGGTRASIIALNQMWSINFNTDPYIDIAAFILTALAIPSFILIFFGASMSMASQNGDKPKEEIQRKERIEKIDEDYFGGYYK